MNTLREAGYTICVMLVITGIFLTILPNGNTKKSVKFVVHLVLIFALIIPIFNVKADFSMADYSYETKEAEISENLSKLYEEEILKSVKKELLLKADVIFDKYDIKPVKIEITMNLKDKTSIDISSMKIYLNETDFKKSDAAIKEITEVFSVTPHREVVK